MKKRLLNLSFILISISINAQITIRENIASTVPKPLPYDSIKDFNQIKDVRQITGQTIFFLPVSGNNKNGIYDNLFVRTKDIDIRIPGDGLYHPKCENINANNPNVQPVYRCNTDPEVLSGQYFIILDVVYTGSDDEGILNEIWLKLLNKELRDTAYMDAGNYDNFTKITRTSLTNKAILVGCFEKKKELIGTKIQLQRYLSTNDLNTGSPLESKAGEWWACTDVTLIDKGEYYKTPVIIAKNEAGNEIGIPFHAYYLTEKEVLEKEQLKKEQEAERLKSEQLAKEKLEKQNQKIKQDFINQFGTETGTLIFNQKVRVGMTKEMCLASWGSPYYINKTIVKGKTLEQWVYSMGNYLYFEGNTLTAIQQRK